jgi:hypothetical protein
MEEPMFTHIADFGFQRSAKQAFGWYLTWLLVGAALFGVIGYVAASSAASATAGFEAGLTAGARARPLYVLLLAAILFWKKQKGITEIALAALGVILSVFLGSLLGLIPLAAVTLRPPISGAAAAQQS